MPLELRRKADGTLKSKWWYGAYEINGKRYVKNLGVKILGTPPQFLKNQGDLSFELSRGRALAKLEQLIADARSTKSSEAIAQNLHEIKYGAKIESVPVKDLVAAWDRMPKKQRTLHPRYIQAVHATINRFISYMSDKHPAIVDVAQITRPIARGFMDSEAARGIADKSWNDSLKRLRAVFRFLQNEYGISRNPFDGIKAHEENHIHRRPFTSEEIERLLKAAETDNFIRPLIVCGLETAMRRGDCCLLKWAEVKLDGEKSSITVKTSKTGQTVCIPIYERLIRELNLAKENSDEQREYVWPAQAKMQLENPHGITWRLKKVFRDAGFTDGEIRAKREDGLRRASVRDFHSLRTTWITEALSRGVPIETVKLISGHTTTDVVTEYYFHPSHEQVRQALRSAMSKMLTDGGNEPTVKEQILGILDGTCARRWAKDAKRIRGLVQKL